uniref:C-type lectin n=1 Tax=Steinernema glaseri TaxID=37863 RepID=A0A1I7ZLS6_9BILA
MMLPVGGLLLALVATVLSAPTCPYKSPIAPLLPAQQPTKWHKRGDFNFTLIEDALPFDQAEATCNYLGGHLASVHSAEEAAFINFFMSTDVSFVGGVHVSDSDKCWTDSSAVNGNFIPDSTDNEAYCIAYVEIGAIRHEFQPRSCQDPAPFVCQVSLSNPLTTPPTTTTAAAITKAPSASCPFQPYGKPIEIDEELTWKPYSTSEYAFIKQAASFGDAEATCVSLGGHLASEHDNGQFLFIGLQTPPLPFEPREFYIGAIQATDNSKCWTDGSEFNFDREPIQGSTPLCVTQKAFGSVGFKWSGVDCAEAYPFICARPKTESPTTTASPTAPTALQCPFKSDRAPIPTPEPQWKLRLLSLNKYAYIAGPLSFQDAQASCAYLKGDLVSAHTLLDSSFYAGLIPKDAQPAWIGGLSPGDDKYCWTDASRWNFDALKNPADKPSCVQINRDGAWSQAECGVAAGYICVKFIL